MASPNTQLVESLAPIPHRRRRSLEIIYRLLTSEAGGSALPHLEPVRDELLKPFAHC